MRRKANASEIFRDAAFTSASYQPPSNRQQTLESAKSLVAPFSNSMSQFTQSLKIAAPLELNPEARGSALDQQPGVTGRTAIREAEPQASQPKRRSERRLSKSPSEQTPGTPGLEAADNRRQGNQRGQKEDTPDTPVRTPRPKGKKKNSSKKFEAEDDFGVGRSTPEVTPQASSEPIAKRVKQSHFNPVQAQPATPEVDTTSPCFANQLSPVAGRLASLVPREPTPDLAAANRRRTPSLTSQRSKEPLIFNLLEDYLIIKYSLNFGPNWPIYLANDLSGYRPAGEYKDRHSVLGKTGFDMIKLIINHVAKFSGASLGSYLNTTRYKNKSEICVMAKQNVTKHRFFPSWEEFVKDKAFLASEPTAEVDAQRFCFALQTCDPAPQTNVAGSQMQAANAKEPGKVRTATATRSPKRPKAREAIYPTVKREFLSKSESICSRKQEFDFMATAGQSTQQVIRFIMKMVDLYEETFGHDFKRRLFWRMKSEFDLEVIDMAHAEKRETDQKREGERRARLSRQT